MPACVVVTRRGTGEAAFYAALRWVSTCRMKRLFSLGFYQYLLFQYHAYGDRRRLAQIVVSAKRHGVSMGVGRAPRNHHSHTCWQSFLFLP